jgi:tRNA U34 2-thiouridine synthase MnmA/TrmU
MNFNHKNVKGLGLCSGGLDSMLSGLILREQGIHVEWITFETPFFPSEKARRASEITGIPITIQPITDVYVEMLKAPNCGYGKHMNPCLDCHALMFRLAGERMKTKGFHFLFSGEVLGQRPMSQTGPSLRYVEKNSGFDGYILRPLSAKRLGETIPEKNGLVNRELLLGITGRGRKKQIRLAKHFGIRDYPAPSGGCLLTDKGYSNRLRDLFKYQSQYSENDFQLLKFGRHFRINDQAKIIVGRTKADNQAINRYIDPARDVIIKTRRYPGPLVVIPNGAPKEMILLAGTMCAGYSKAPQDMPVQVKVQNRAEKETVTVLGVPPKKFSKYLIR